MKYVIVFLLCLMLTACAGVKLQPTNYHSYQAVVLIKLGPHSWGSGVIVGDHKILTAAHVAVEGKTFKVIEADGDTYTATYVSAGKPGTETDYGVLKADKISNPKAVVSCEALQVGEQIVHVGYPVAAAKPTRIRTYGRIASMSFGDQRHFYNHTILADLLAGPGSSGGGIFHNGKLVALLVGGVKLGGNRGIGGLSIIIRPPSCHAIHPVVK